MEFPMCSDCKHYHLSIDDPPCYQCQNAFREEHTKPYFEASGKTNADRIRGFTNDELADWIDKEFGSAPWCKDDAPVDPETKRCAIWDCTKCIKDWLNEEAQ